MLLPIIFGNVPTSSDTLRIPSTALGQSKQAVTSLFFPHIRKIGTGDPMFGPLPSYPKPFKSKTNSLYYTDAFLNLR